MKAITPDAKVFKAHLLELGYMFGQGELRTPHNHPSTPYLYRQTLETFDQPESRLHVCNGTAERPCGHTFGHLPRDQWTLHKKEVCPKCKLSRFEGDRDNLRPRAELFYLELEETLNTMLLSPGMQMWFNRDVDKGPGSFYASEAGKFMRDSVGADQFDNPYAVRLSLGIDWVKITETQSVGIIVLQVMDVPTKYMSKDETWAIVGVILGADKSKFVEGYVNQLLVDLRDSLDESKRDCWVHLHAPKGYRGANEATKIRLYPMLASVVADTPARGVVGEWFEAWMWDRRNRLSEWDMQTRGAAVEGGWVKGTDIGCWGRPIVTKYLKYVQAKWLHVVPIAHAFLFGVVKHHMQWLFSKSGPFSKRQGNDKESPRETMIKRFQDMHFPVTFGRRLKHTEDFTGWIMDDFMHFVRYGWQYVFRDIVTVENGHLPIWKALVKAVPHYLTSEGDPQRSLDMTPEAEALYEARLKAGMDEGADAIHTYAYLLAEKDWLGEDVTEFFVERAMQRAKHFSGSHAAGLQVTLAMCLRERLSRQMQQWFNTHRHKHGRDAWAEEQEGEGMDEEGEENEEGREAAGQQGRKKSEGVRDAKPLPAEEVCQLLGCDYSECPNGGEGEEWVRQACIKFREEFLAESIEWSDADFNAVFADPVSGASPAVPQRVKYFKRAECNGQVMHSVDYTKVHVRNSNWVMNQYLQIIPGQYTGEHELPSPAQPSPAQPSPAQPSPAQPSPAQPSPAQPSPAQPSPAQPSPAQPSPAQPSPAQPSPAQPSPAQPSPAQPSPAQPSPAQPSPAQPSPAQPSPAQPSPAQPSPAQPSPAQPSPAQPSPAQPSPAQPSPAQPSPAQPSPAQPSPAQPSPAQPSPAQPSPAQPSPAQPSPAQPSPAQPSPAQPRPGASGSGQQDQEQGQAVKVVIGERRHVIKAALRGLVEAARPDLSPVQVDAVVAEVNKRMTMGSKQCVLAAVLCLVVLLQSFLAHPALQPPQPSYPPPVQLGIWDPQLLVQIRDAMELITKASVLEHLMRGPHHRGIRLLPGELDEEHLVGDGNSLNANATTIITSIQEFYRHPGRFIHWWCKAVGVVEGGFSRATKKHFPQLVLGRLDYSWPYREHKWRLPPNSMLRQPRWKEEVAKHRRLLGLPAQWREGMDSIGKGGAGRLPLEKRVRYALFVNRNLEGWQTPHDTCPRPFTMLPMVGVRARHFVIDDRVLHGLLIDLGMTNLTQRQFEADSLPHWQKFIQYSQLQNSGWEFARRVETDGVSISVHFVRSQAVTEPVELPSIGRKLTATSDYDPATHIAVGDTNGCLNLQRIGESRQRPIELCHWKDREVLPPIGKEYQQRYKLVNDRLPKGRQRLHGATEYRRGIDGRARNNA
ncbi:hypothetical protein QJQ45_029013 [Haematococcus lacustris]|nr:hypothetical protein QJQ45_029013 [Haematococcus lacustris]